MGPQKNAMRKKGEDSHASAPETRCRTADRCTNAVRMGEELLKAWLDGQLSKPVINFEKARLADLKSSFDTKCIHSACCIVRLM